jgi:DNA polymerase-3 subunit alpha (Gram-positive type)
LYWTDFWEKNNAFNYFGGKMGEYQRIIKPQENIFGVENVYVNEIIFDERNKKITLKCDVVSPKNLDELDIIHDKMRKKFRQELEINFKLKYKTETIEIDDIKEIVERSIKILKEERAIAKSFLYFYRIFIDKKENKYFVYLELNNEMAIETLKGEKVDIKLEEIIRDYGIDNSKIEFILGDFKREISQIVEMNEDKLKKIALDIDSKNIQNVNFAAKNSGKTISFKNNNSGNSQNFINNNKNSNKNWSNKISTIEIKEMPIKIDEFYNLIDGEGCAIEGKIFHYEEKKTKYKIRATLGLTDDKNSLFAGFWKDQNFNQDFSAIKYIKVSGKKNSVNKYNNNEPELEVSAMNFLDIKEKKIEDHSKEKMVELHTHSKMSEMSGVCDVKDIINRAVEYGHSAIAITDYSTVHSFPVAYKAVKEISKKYTEKYQAALKNDDSKKAEEYSKLKDFKLILGCEVYIVKDDENIIRNPKDINFDDETFVVFDIETCGLNAHKNPIIEIGAIKLKGTRPIDKFSKLINPKQSIPSSIQKLTNITDSMVSNEPTIDEVLPEFLQFVGDATMVAHNAMFDMGFIKRDAKKILNIDYSPTVMDTMTLAKALYPDRKSYSLDALNKLLGLSLETHHRAVEDAQATANMFTIFLEKYRDLGVANLKDFDSAIPKNIKNADSYNCMILVKNKTGLKNLYELISKGHIDYYGNKKSKIPKSLLQEKREGLIIGCSLTAHNINSSELLSYYMRYDFNKIEENINFYDYIEFIPKDAYMELYDKDGSRTISSLDMIEEMNKYFYGLAKTNEILVTASSNIHYMNEEDAILRSVLVFGSGTAHKEFLYATDNKFYFRTTEQLLKEFKYFDEEIAKEIVITNTNKIANMIENISPIPQGFYPPKIDNADEIIKEMTYKKAYKIYGDPLPEIVDSRIKRELDAIINNGFAVLYLSAQKLVKKSLDNGYLVGSRGSVGSSLVAFMMDITEVNALYPHYICDNEECKYSEFTDKEGAGVDLPPKNCPKCNAPLRRDGFTIPFEVFMGFKGNKTPDIDLNFSGEYQSEIHRYCETLFGKENVFKAGTISTLAEKNAIGYIRKYYEENKLSISNAHINKLAKKIDGAKKTTGQHPGGMIVVPEGTSIYEFCPVQKPANDQTSDSITTHFDYHEMEDQLVKLDILGHDDPTTIKLLQEYTGIDVYKISIVDKDTLKIFSSTESLGIKPEDINSLVGTFGIPEFGTSFVRQMLVETKPKTFAELVRIAGLSHGTDVWANNAQDFVKSGAATLSQIITVRDDIMNYLIDQGLEKSIAFDIMEFVRRGKPSSDPKQWDVYSKMMKEKNVADWYIESCGRIKYMFPKGHAVAYVMMAMRIAYFKVHHPLAFYAAFFSRKAEDFDYEIMKDIEKVKEQISILTDLNKEKELNVKNKAQFSLCEVLVEMNARKFEFLPIDIYKSDAKKFTLENGKIRFPLIAINGLGESVAKKIIDERAIEGFLSYEDLKKRTQMSNTVLLKLKNLGGIDNLSETNQISLF